MKNKLFILFYLFILVFTSNVNAAEVKDSGISECYFYYDVLASDKCKDLYAIKGAEGIIGLMSEPEVFTQCIFSNCGSYIAKNQSEIENTYIYKMETLKGCVVLEENELTGDKLPSTDWFKADMLNPTDKPTVSQNDSIEKLIPFKIIQYQCPSYKEEVCIKGDRVAQSPVMCLKSSSTDMSLALKFQRCYVDHDKQACEDVKNEPGGPANYIEWRYCDEDRNGDGFPESLSIQSQALCNRSDASTLKCEKGSSCSVIAKCAKVLTVASTSSTFGECNNINRNFTTHTVNTECGNMSDIYRENPSCVRISNATEARSVSGARTYSFKSNSGDWLDDYQEFMIYRKKADFQHENIFGALFFPQARYKKKSGWSLAGFDLDNIFPPLGSSSTKVSTIIDNHIPEAIDNNFTILSTDDIKGVTWKTKTEKNCCCGVCKKKLRMKFQKAWWNSNIVSNFSVDDYIWDGFTPKSMKYSFDITTQPEDLLVTYNINTRGNKSGAPSINLKQYNNIATCSDSTVQPSMGFKTFVPGDSHDPLHVAEITRMGVLFPYTGTYEFEFWDDSPSGSKIVFETTKFFKKDVTGATYPEMGVNLFNGGQSVNINIERGSATAEADGIADAVAAKLNTSVIKNKIDIITDNVITAIGKKNNDKFRNLPPITIEKEIYDYNETQGLRDLYIDIAVEKAHTTVYDDADVSLASASCFDSIPDASGSSTSSLEDADTMASLNSSRNAIFQCVKTMDEMLTGMHDELNTEIKNALTSSVVNRENRTKEMTLKVYNDYTKVMNTIDYYFNKESNIEIKTSVGIFNVSFKSSCGDYEDAKNDAIINFKNGINTFTRDNYSTQIGEIRDELVTLLENHYDDVTITYEYQEVKREGTEKWDDRHNAEEGTYSCEYKVGEICTDDDNNISTPDVCVDDNRTDSGSCSTYGLAGSYSKCRTQCENYHRSYWGNSYDDTRGDLDDVINDQDKSCDGNYTFYKTDDYFTSYYNNKGDTKFVTGTTEVYFKSAGSYSCDNFAVTPTGFTNSKCSDEYTPFNKHDLVISTSYSETDGDTFQWTSVAKALDISEDEAKILMQRWMKDNEYINNINVSNYIFDYTDIYNFNNVYIDLAATTDNPIHVDADDYIKNAIKVIITNIYKELYTIRYTNELKFQIQDSEVNSYVQNYVDIAYNAANPPEFHPFNRIKIKDANGMKEHPYSMNFDIPLPGGLYVRHAQNFNFVVTPHKEIRKYNCYTTWPECDLAKDMSCALEETKDTMHVADMDHKWVPVTRDEKYNCQKVVENDTCSEWEYTKKCNNIKLGDYISDYDDNDFTNAFYQGVGEAIAISESISLFGGQELRCERGLFVDASWLTDPGFWMSAVTGINMNQFQGGTDTPDGINALAGDRVSPSVCAKKWANCMNDNGFSITDIAASMIDMNGDEYGGCQVNTNWSGMTPNKMAENCDNLLHNPGSGCEDYCYSCGLDAYNEPFKEFLNQTANDMAQDGGGGDSSLTARNAIENLTNTSVPIVGTVVAKLVFDTVNWCNQCNDKSCAESHEPHESVELFKLTNGLDAGGLIEGSEYGLGNNFKAYNMCFLKDKGDCAYRILGMCKRRRDTFCCYNGKIPRMLVGQIYQQMGWKFDRDGCEKVTLQTLADISFKPCPVNNPVPSPYNKCVNFNEMKDYILNQTNWDLEKTVDLSDNIQGVLDAIDKLN